MSFVSNEVEVSLTLEQIEEKIYETQLLKTCQMSENNHVHHFHDELDDPTEYYREQKGVNIEELFFDLVFVGAGGNITHGLRLDHLSWEDYFLYMGVILIFWKNFSVNRSIFDTSDLLDKFFAMWYGAGVAGLAVFSTSGLSGDTCGYFGDCCVFLSLLQILLDGRGFYGMNVAMGHDKRADHRENKSYNYMIFCIGVDFVKIIFWVAFGLTDDAKARRPILWFQFLFPMVIDGLSSVTFPRDAQIFTPVLHMNERFEAITLIMLGETILGVTPALTYATTSPLVITSILCSYFVMFLYKTFHYDVEEYGEQIHALYLGGFRRVIWMYFTILECVGIILLGSGCGELVDAVLKSEAKPAAAHHRMLSGGGGDKSWEQMVEKSIAMLCVGTAVALGANMFCRFSHGIEIGNFTGATTLWYVQQCTQFITIWIIVPLPFIMYAWEEEFPYVCAVLIIVILFGLDMLFFMDEMLENIYLKRVRDEIIAERSGNNNSNEPDV